MKYYAGTYRDCDGRVLKVTDDIDCQSCETESQPGIISSEGEPYRVTTMLCWAFELAGQFGCHHVEIDCEKGHGSYKWLKY